MDDLTRFDVAADNGIFMVVIENDLPRPDPSVVVIPLLSGYPAVRRSHVKRVGHVADQGDLITRAVDVLVAGI